MGWLGSVLCVIGAIAVGRQVGTGFLFTFAGCVLWTCTAVHRGMLDLAAVEAFFAGISIWSWFSWKLLDRQAEEA